jgi:hypothetical protein
VQTSLTDRLAARIVPKFLTALHGASLSSSERAVVPLLATVLAVPQVRVAARWISGTRVASIETWVAGEPAPQVTGEIPMHAPADNIPSSPSVLMRFLVRSWEYRRPRLWVGVRVACGIFNVALGVALLASVSWLGPLTWLAALPLAGAALIFWTVYRLQQGTVQS